MIDRAHENPEAWADRPLGGDGGTLRGTNGAAAGTSGFALTLGAWALAAALMALVTFVNVTTILDDAHNRGVRMPLALPVTLEATSAVAALASLVIVVVALRIAPPGRGPLWRTIAVHAAGTLAFSVAHVMLMTLLRTVIFALAGHRYEFSLSEMPYEYRKDLLSYLVIGGIFWLVARERERQAAAGRAASIAAPTAEPAGRARPATYDIRDGASISAVESALAPHGFVRTHRSWLVNAARVRALTAAGSGDFRLDLGCGLTAPLSRRYPAALSRLRGDGPAPSQSSA